MVPNTNMVLEVKTVLTPKPLLFRPSESIWGPCSLQHLSLVNTNIFCFLRMVTPCATQKYLCPTKVTFFWLKYFCLGKSCFCQQKYVCYKRRPLWCHMYSSSSCFCHTKDRILRWFTRRMVTPCVTQKYLCPTKVTFSDKSTSVLAKVASVNKSVYVTNDAPFDVICIPLQMILQAWHRDH